MKLDKILLIIPLSLFLLSSCGVILSSTTSENSSISTTESIDSNNPTTSITSGIIETALISDLLKSGISGNLYKVRGTVTSLTNDGFYMQSGSSAIYVEDFFNIESDIVYEEGNEVEVFGRYSLDREMPMLYIYEQTVVINLNGPVVTEATIFNKDFTYINLSNSLSTLVQLSAITNISRSEGGRYNATFYDKDLYIYFDDSLTPNLNTEAYYQISGNLIYENNTLGLFVSKTEYIEKINSVEEINNLITWTTSNQFTQETYKLYGTLSSTINKNSDPVTFNIKGFSETIYVYGCTYLNGISFSFLEDENIPKTNEMLILEANVGYHSSVGKEIKNAKLLDIFTSREIVDPDVPEVTDGRRNPVTATGNQGAIYQKDGSVYKVLAKDTYYTELEDVAAYIVTFMQLPPNYYIIDRNQDSSGYPESKRVCYEQYQSSCRLSPGYYSSNYSYLPKSLDGRYLEVDIGGEGYASGPTWNRGALRIVLTYQGISQYGQNVPVLFYTGDHYDTFTEYANYYQGWGSTFGSNGTSWSPMDTITN